MSVAAVKSAPGKSAKRASVVRARGTTPRAKTAPETRIIRREVGAATVRSAAHPVRKAAPADAARRRRVVVFGGLVGVLTVTSALLLAMQPAPLVPQSVRSLMSLTAPADVESLFDTQVPVRDSRWKYIYVHHGGLATSASGGSRSANGASDHFVIGNGDGAGDGEIHLGQRWNSQQAAGAVTGVEQIDSDCVSICVAGDLDRSPPTPKQMEQLVRLVTSLQNKFQIGRDRVRVVDTPGMPAGIGRYFPRDAFRGGLLP